MAATLSILTAASTSASAAASPCGATINPVACENSQTAGVTDSSVWDIDGAGDSSIQGFSTDISANAGSSIGMKIDTTLAYSIDIYRLGYYGGKGARLWQSNLAHSAPAKQPACLTDASTLLYDCGNWALSATWAVPSNAVSGVYIAKLTATNGDESHITFIVRNDASTSDIVYQTSDETWQAYNSFGGSDYYVGTSSLTGSQARAFKISYNRPFATRDGVTARDFLFANEYPTIRFLERNGYDVSYISGVDADRSGSLLLNHKTYMSVGHDEYWSGQQRANVENARDHGVNLMFLSGNEVYWHTRFEPSIDGTNTNYRTLVCYKETWDAAKIDPSPTSTSTWRDPRFGVFPNSADPENALTGTMYMSNSDDLAVTVTQAQGKTRLWRDTGLNAMTSANTALAPHTVGYESDEDIDNGFRPAGLVDLSTTVGPTPQYLQDFGLTVSPGTTTHHLTLYRASSGALVFGAGTIQWAWSLDQYHDVDNSSPPDARMQQATINMLADMNALPTTLMAGLVSPTPSSDTTAPTVSITTPTAGAAVANGASMTVSGTATDVGGVVAGVEVSLDGGTTWHPATGTTSWSYVGVMHGIGPAAIKVRATDDSANTSSPVAVSQTVNCPCSLFGTSIPTVADGGDAAAVELGVRFSSSTDGYVSGVRFFKASTNTGSHTGTLWSASGQALATGTFTGESASGWQTLQFSAPVAITADTTYVVSYFAPNGHYSIQSSLFYYKDYAASPLTARATTPDQTSVNGVFTAGHGFPTSSYQGANYFVDVTFSSSASVPPSVVSHTPASDASSVAITAAPTATFSKAMNSATLTFTLTDSANNPVAGVLSYNSASKTATFTPSAPLVNGALYTATVNGADANGNALPAAVTWSFRTAFTGQVGGTCPCTIFSDSTVPSTVTVQDPSSVELGVKFTADTDGIVTGVRFYKGAQNIGSHTGSLWTAGGTQLATAVFTNETSTGWQTVSFSTPVQVTAGTTYVASYHTSGFYSASSGAYASSGLDNFPLHVPTGGAVYSYSSAFPSNSSTTDYGVDVVFSVPASVVPTITASTPAPGDTNIGTASKIVATFNTSILAGTAAVTVTPAGGSAIAGTLTLDAVHKVLTFTPSAPLASATTYTVSVNGARTLVGTPQPSATTWTFSTLGGTNCPCSLFGASVTPSTVDSGDASAISLGVQIVPSSPGFITGLRFYKSAANTGTHTGSVWSASGVRLATVTFVNETASGWQSATFSTPLAVTAGATYTVSYYAPNGHYAATGHYFDTTYDTGVLSVAAASSGVYQYGSDTVPASVYANTNYWVDPTFTIDSSPDSTPPTVASTTPIDNAGSVVSSVAPTATYSEPLTVSTATITVKDSAGTTVAGTKSLDATAQKVTFTPTNPLTAATKYTVTTTASDKAGNAMAAPFVWSFMTASGAQSSCPCGLWDDSATPAVINDSDGLALEVGLTFTSGVNGTVSGVQFYKGTQNTGTHTGSLWTAAGQRVATGTFTGESSTGWQTLTFTTPYAITAGTPYVVSYHTDSGHISYTTGAFATTGLDSGSLHVAVHGGAYVYGASAFPGTASDANYWADVLFTPASGGDVTPPVTSAVTATPTSAATATVSWTTDEAASTKVIYGTSATALTATATATGLSTSHSVALSGLTASTTYYYRVVSADAAGNSTTSPATTAAAASFATPAPADTTPPVVTGVTATPAGTSATVAWTTNEAATTRVDYGTSATTLNLNSTVAGLSTAHSVTLTGLAANTRYYYRVTSADAAANATTSPATSSAAASFAPTIASFTDSTSANFTAGTLATATVSDFGDGEVISTPTTNADFTAATLPTGWTSTAVVAGGTSTFSGGNATVLGATLATSATYTNGKSLEAQLVLRPGQSFGWASSTSSSVKTTFSVNASNQLVAAENDGFANNASSVVATGWTAVTHKLRIEWTSSAVTFYLDDVQKYTHAYNSAFYPNLRPFFTDPVRTDAGLVIDWARVGPYAASSTFTSRVLDASAPVIWDGLSWDATAPAGTTMVVRVRTGNTATPDASWSAYTTMATSGASVGRTSRYLQYQVSFTTSGNRFVTPTLRSVQVAAHV